MRHKIHEELAKQLTFYFLWLDGYSGNPFFKLLFFLFLLCVYIQYDVSTVECCKVSKSIRSCLYNSAFKNFNRKCNYHVYTSLPIVVGNQDSIMDKDTAMSHFCFFLFELTLLWHKVIAVSF